MPERLDVLVLNPGLAIWGAEVILLNHAKALAAHNIHLTLGCPSGTLLAERWVEEGHDHIDVPIGKRVGLRSADGSGSRPGPREALSFASTTANHVRHLRKVAKDFDVLHSYSLDLHIDVATVGRLVRRPTMIEMVDIVRPGFGRKVLQAASRLATVTVTLSDASAVPVGGVGRIEVVHPGVDLNRFTPGPADQALRASLSSDPDAPIVGIFGRLDKTKNVDDVIRAVSMLTGDAAKTRLVVVGDRATGPESYKEGLIALGDELLGDRVNFLGRRSDVPELLRAIDIAVNASEAEPFGLNALEAQASGTALVAANAGGIPEFVEHEVSGLLIEPGQPAQIAAAIQRYIEEPELRERIVAEALKRAHPARGLDAQYDKIASIYRSLV